MAKRINSTPRQDGFRMPGEFEDHAGCWIIWPERTDNWRLGAKPGQKAFVAVAKAISEFEPVTVAVSEAQYLVARQALPDTIRVVELSNNDAWVRDMGPTFVVNEQGEVRGVDWEFNAWGGLVDGLYFPWDKDDRAALKICEIEGMDSYRTEGFVLEGGSIHTDGEGTVIVTEECLLSDGRNPGLNRADIEAKLGEYLGVEKVLWVPRGIYNDETNGHVDNILHYVGPAKIVLAWTTDETDVQYEISREALSYLESQTDARGRTFEITKLHIPDPVLITAEEADGVDPVDGTLPREEGDRMAASYANFYIANNGVVVPTFGDPVHDQLALETLARVFPDRKIVGVYAREIILGGGNIHCITQQQPSGK